MPLGDRKTVGVLKSPEEARGHCFFYAAALASKDPSLKLIKGTHSKQRAGDTAHFWLEDKAGKIIDPTASQYEPGEYKKEREVDLKKNVGHVIKDPLFGKLHPGDQAAVLKHAAARLLPAKGEFAPGIPSSRTIRPLPPVPRGQPQQWHLAEQAHHADKAGKHVDLRLVDPEGHAHSWVLPETGLPKPGEKFYLPQTFTHTKDYAARKGEFDIPEGYGKGKVVGSGLRPVDVHYSEPDKLRFSLLEGRNPQDYILIRSPKGWVIHNFSPTAEAGVRGSKGQPIPLYRPGYKEKRTDTVDFDDPRVIHQAKIDGAHVSLVFPDKGSQVRVFSYRPAQSGTGIIEHTHKLPDYHALRTPGSLAGTVLRGEAWAAGPDGRALPAERIGGLLNANVARSRELQQEHGPLRLSVFDVVRHKGKLMEAAPYAEKLEVLRQVAKEMPQLQLPPMAETSKEKLELFTRIQEGREPTTKEGIVAWHLDKPVPTKIKFRPDVDAEVVDVFPGKGKHEGRAGGVLVKVPGSETTTRVGTGFSDQMRKELWDRPQEFVGRVARVATQQVFPSGKLRAPSFGGFHLDKNAAQTFTSDGKDYDVSKLWELAKHLPVEELRVSSRAFKKNLEGGWGDKVKPLDVIKDPSVDPEHSKRIQEADLSHPVTMSIGSWVADGLHRMAKAKQMGLKSVPVQRFRSFEQMEPALIKKEASAIMAALRRELNRIGHG